MPGKRYTLAQLRGAWGAGKSSADSSPPAHDIKDFPAGLWFHAAVDGQPEQQGYIRHVRDGLALVRFHDWLDGMECGQQIMAVKDMQGWSFYGGARDLRLAIMRKRGMSQADIDNAERFTAAVKRIMSMPEGR